MPGHFESGQVAAAERDEFCRRGGRCLTQDDKSHTDFTHTLVGDGYDVGLQYRRMG